jgi:hypothetical protein
MILTPLIQISESVPDQVTFFLCNKIQWLVNQERKKGKIMYFMLFTIAKKYNFVLYTNLMRNYYLGTNPKKNYLGTHS